MDSLPFILVEEAIKKNKSSIKLQEFVALMIWERARIEQNYVKELQTWSDRVAGEGQVFQDDEVFRLIADILPGEAEVAAEAHRRVYKHVLEENGPYIVLYRDMGLREGIFHKNIQGVLGLEEVFVKDNRRRINLESALSKKKKECKTNMDDIESQMSCRSRLATRRSAKGRRVDALMTRMIDQKRRYDQETEGSDVIEREMETLVQGKKLAFLEMLNDLSQLEKDRTKLIFEQLQEFLKRLRPVEVPEESANRRRGMDDMLQALANVDTESVANSAWRKMERAARARKLGAVFSLKDLIAPTAVPSDRPVTRTPMPSCSAKGVERFFGSQSLLRSRNTRRGAEARRCAEPSEEKTNYPVESTSVHSLKFLYSSAESVTSVAAESDHSDHVNQYGTNITATRPDISATSVPSDDIETIYLPEEDIPRYRAPAPFPPRLFCPSVSDEGELEDERLQDFSEEVPVAEDTDIVSFDLDTCPIGLFHKPPGREEVEEYEEEEEKNVQANLPLMRNVRVISLHAYNGRKPGELSFKQGQVIKQKAGANEDGFAFGWMREGKLSQKQYGLYPLALVKLMVPQPKTMFKHL